METLLLLYNIISLLPYNLLHVIYIQRDIAEVISAQVSRHKLITDLNKMEMECPNTRVPGTLCLPCLVRDTA